MAISKTRFAFVVVLLFLSMDTTFGKVHEGKHTKSHLLEMAKNGAKRFMHIRKRHLEEQPETEQEKLAREKAEKEKAEKENAKAEKGDGKEKGGDDEDSEAEEAAEANKKMYMFLAFVFVTIVVLGFITYGIAKANFEKFNEGQTLTSAQFMGFDQMVPKLIAVGMASGLVFGFIDNAGLFFGMEYLDPFLAKLPMGDEQLVNAGYGNTFSDMIGAFLGTFAGRIIEEKARESEEGGVLGDYPIWTEAVGITLGCIIGVAIPRSIVDPKKKLISEATAKALRSGMTQEKIDRVMAKFDELDRTLDKERPGQVQAVNLKKATGDEVDDIIALADENGNRDGWVSREEVYEELVRAAKKAKKFHQGEAKDEKKKD